MLEENGEVSKEDFLLMQKKRDQEIKLANGNFEIRKYYFRSYS